MNKIAKCAGCAPFTVENHLQVQRQIEFLAHALWHAGDCRHETALGDWLQAERAVLAQFVGDYATQHGCPLSAKCTLLCIRQKGAPIADRRTVLQPALSLIN